MGAGQGFKKIYLDLGEMHFAGDRLYLPKFLFQLYCLGEDDANLKAHPFDFLQSNNQCDGK